MHRGRLLTLPHGIVIVYKRLVRFTRKSKFTFIPSCGRIKRKGAHAGEIFYIHQRKGKKKNKRECGDKRRHSLRRLSYIDRNSPAGRARRKVNLRASSLRLKILCKSSSISLWEQERTEGRRRGEKKMGKLKEGRKWTILSRRGKNTYIQGWPHSHKEIVHSPCCLTHFIPYFLYSLYIFFSPYLSFFFFFYYYYCTCISFF